MSRPVGTTSRHPVRTTIAVAVLSALIMFIGAESAAAGEQRGAVDAPGADLRSASSTPSRTATPDPAPTPTSTPTPTPTSRTTHEQQNGEQGVQRTDLGFLGVAFLFGIGFLLAAGALGVLLSGRARRRRDRAEAAAREERSDVA
ncbi:MULTISPECIES: hypothetical protein [unclassified Microbacterium]|uniref:hypothetical protein n=1 Tax=unclassified Microbacterium TaxID=2609290 RepID=UPI000CFB9649|nr:MULTISPECIES: hypothetical protein [unclassified Microbacterium]PQZ54840.1 hypothetical protein CQ032_13070 [Microbacterium sp. MYb43]PRB25891.1 hypothetical protein CQ037_14250 [Microbacterium sp. MYb50]PRB64385.1 hypothetical protein CQ021_14680 [Microbacterium sp. MYb24]PRB73114.1 hypothetical protein CQ027_14020 [Microbacterium sp. MYb32]